MKWFESWFDTAYYHALYAHRNDAEAMAFMDALVGYLRLESGAKVIDVACGKGRHAAHLAELGMDVLGFDLSENELGRHLFVMICARIFLIRIFTRYLICLPVLATLIIRRRMSGCFKICTMRVCRGDS